MRKRHDIGVFVAFKQHGIFPQHRSVKHCGIKDISLSSKAAVRIARTQGWPGRTRATLPAVAASPPGGPVRSAAGLAAASAPARPAFERLPASGAGPLTRAGAPGQRGVLSKNRTGGAKKRARADLAAHLARIAIGEAWGPSLENWPAATAPAANG